MDIHICQYCISPITAWVMAKWNEHVGFSRGTSCQIASSHHITYPYGNKNIKNMKYKKMRVLGISISFFGFREYTHDAGYLMTSYLSHPASHCHDLCPNART